MQVICKSYRRFIGYHLRKHEQSPQSSTTPPQRTERELKKSNQMKSCVDKSSSSNPGSSSDTTVKHRSRRGAFPWITAQKTLLLVYVRCWAVKVCHHIVKATELNSWTRLPCFGHRLHVAVGNSLNNFYFVCFMGVMCSCADFFVKCVWSFVIRINYNLTICFHFR